MKAIICGGRDYHLTWSDEIWLSDQLYKLEVTEVLHGDAPGADTEAGKVASWKLIKVIPFPADWKRHGKAAGPIRNKAMLDYGAQIVIAFPGGKGTENMVKQARERGVRVIERGGKA